MTLNQAIEARQSIRAFQERPIEAGAVQELEQAIAGINADHGLHIQLILDEPQAFKSPMAKYGMFSGCSNYLVMAAHKGAENDEKIGYYGEKLVLLAQTLGLSSCWVGLTYKKISGAYALEAGEKIACVIALGYAAANGRSHKIRSIEDVSNYRQGHPEWFRIGVQAALKAPTAVNQQKFYFELKEDLTTVKATAKHSLVGYTNIDLGIAKCHFEIAVNSVSEGKQLFRMI